MGDKITNSSLNNVNHLTEKLNNDIVNDTNKQEIQEKQKIKQENDKQEIDNENKIMDMGDINNILKELLIKQIKNIDQTKKLSFSDIKRISKFLQTSIFDENNCSIWNGYITNEKNQSKGTYINFYFNKKKIALHRLLYINYVEDISDEEYIKYTCDNKGKCCNIHHMVKNSFAKNTNDKPKKNNNKNNKVNDAIQINVNKNKLIIDL